MKFEFTISSYIIVLLLGFFWYVGFIEFHPDRFPGLGGNYVCVKGYQYEVLDGKLIPRKNGEEYVVCAAEEKK